MAGKSHLASLNMLIQKIPPPVARQSPLVATLGGNKLFCIFLPPNLIHQRLELVYILKTPVHAGKAYVGHLVELF